MNRSVLGRITGAGLAAALGLVGTMTLSSGLGGASGPATSRHVLLISIDGFHQSDLVQCEANNECPNLAMLAGHGTTYTNAMTSEPSDSAPGTMALATGSDPKLTGVYYDDSYDRTMFTPAAQTGTGTQTCTSTPGAETMYAENVDVNAPTASNPNGTRTILGETLDPTQFPYAKQNGVCSPVA